MELALQAAQVVSAGASVLALLLIWIQLRYQSRQVEFECLTSLHQELASGPMQQAIRFIYNASPEVIVDPQAEADLEKIELVLNTFDLVGYRVRKGILPKKATLETEWMILVPLWSRVHPFVARQRALRGNVPYKQHLEWLAEEAETYRRRYYPGRTPTTFEWSFAATSIPSNTSRETPFSGGAAPKNAPKEHRIEAKLVSPNPTTPADA